MCKRRPHSPGRWKGHLDGESAEVLQIHHDENFGLVSPRTTTLPSVNDSIRLEYDFDVVTVKR
jgi:hypothetical protein